MNNDVCQALLDFTQRYIDLWQSTFGHAPKSELLHGIISPCIVKTAQLEVYWQAVRQDPAGNLNIAQELVGITIRPEIHTLFGTQFAGDMVATFENSQLCLIQAWSQDDFYRLEKNLIAHLQMQKRLKRQPTLFIASLADDTKLISVNNITGHVICEDLISGEYDELAQDLSRFLSKLIPSVEPLS